MSDLVGNPEDRFSHVAAQGLLTNVLINKFTALRKVQVGKDQEKAQSEKDSHSKNRDGKKLN